MSIEYIDELNKIIRYLIKYNKITEDEILGDKHLYVKQESPKNENGLTVSQQEDKKLYIAILRFEFEKRNKENKKFYDRRLLKENTIYSNKKELEKEINKEIETLISEILSMFEDDYINWYNHTKHSYTREKINRFIEEFNYKLMNIRSSIFMYKGIKNKPTVNLLVQQRKEVSELSNNKPKLSLKQRKELNLHEKQVGPRQSRQKQSNLKQSNRKPVYSENNMKYSKGLLHYLQLNQQKKKNEQYKPYYRSERTNRIQRTNRNRGYRSTVRHNTFKPINVKPLVIPEQYRKHSNVKQPVPRGRRVTEKKQSNLPTQIPLKKYSNVKQPVPRGKRVTEKLSTIKNA